MEKLKYTEENTLIHAVLLAGALIVAALLKYWLNMAICILMMGTK